MKAYFKTGMGMIKIITIVGARPQIIKAAALSRAIKNSFSDRIQEILVHTGQHYDENMSEVFFSELGIPSPDYNLNVGSGTHGKQTAAMITGIEEIIIRENPHAIVLYGDTNSTLAGAVAASKLHLPVIHIEAGLRSFNKSMPEEINRIMSDHVSTLLFSPTKTGVENLSREGFDTKALPPYTIDNPRVYHCGDVMYDNSMFFSAIAEEKTDIVSRLGFNGKSFILSTIHRDNNTDNPSRLSSIFRALDRISRENDSSIIIPLHPRTSKLLAKGLGDDLYSTIEGNDRIKILPPVSFLEMIALEKNAEMIITDSGGVQKEAFFFKKPCIILRPETEWTELLETGAAVIADADEERIFKAWRHFREESTALYPQLYGDGRAAEFICAETIKLFDKQ
jgi:UDP-GlcNAc3NAcA epimerase